MSQTEHETSVDTHEPVLLEDHSYDGIMEYDNPTPGWWNLIWFGTIVFSILYLMVFHFSPLILKPHQKLAAEQHKAMEAMFSEIADTPLTDQKMLMLMNDEKWHTIGEGIFKVSCAKCHGSNGEGFQGPNMTDDYYKNIKSLTDFFNVIKNGAGGGTMPAQVSLNDSQITVVAAYMASLRGKNLQGPRPPEGEKIPPWPAYEPDAAGSTETGEEDSGESGT